MFFKLALNNFKKSFKDYTIYFLTLTFGVSLFYTFNSLESQQSMLSLNKEQHDMIRSMMQMIGVVSVFIAVILGFLVVYATRFLIKRRKKELGTYLLLGMERGTISRMLVVETILIGFFALGAGLALGIALSQGLAVLTAKMFEMTFKEFKFVFSGEAALKTILYFGIIFIVVMLFNTITVSRFKLIDLLSAAKRNERLKVKRLWVSVILFLISAGCLGAAYYMIRENGMLEIDSQFMASIILGTIGTFLFFLSLSGFLLRVVKMSKGIYLRGLNMFVLRQINSKITTTFVSMTLICLMLLMAIGTLSSGIGFVKAFNTDMYQAALSDATITVDYTNPERVHDHVGIVKKFDPELENYADLHEVRIYDSGLVLRDMLSYQAFYDSVPNMQAHLTEKLWDDHTGNMRVTLISLSDYNQVRKSAGESELKLKGNEIILNTAGSEVELKPLKKGLKQTESLTIDGTEYRIHTEKIYENSYATSGMEDAFTLIVPDEILQDKVPVMYFVNMHYKGDYETAEEYIRAIDDEKLLSKMAEEANEPEGGYRMLTSRQELVEATSMTKMMISYITIYIGAIFLITSAAVLALQQLSESSDNVERYALLRKIGVDNREINKSLFVQILIYFLVPLALALLHSYVGVGIINEIMNSFGHLDVMDSILYCGAFLLLIYGGYMLATYFGSKIMIRERNRS